MSQLNVHDENVDVDSIKSANKYLLHEIFDLQDEVFKLEKEVSDRHSNVTDVASAN